MLSTTVAYLNVMESRRHNVEAERQGRTQLAINKGELAVHQGQLAVAQGQLEETKRHNVQTEALGWENLYETRRHNQATEQIQSYSAETQRMHLDVDWYNAYTNRWSAQQQAAIGYANVAVNQQNADTNRINAQTQRQRMSNDYSLGLQNYSVSKQNADTNRKVAETRQAELEQKIWKDQADVANKQRELQIKQNQYDLDYSFTQQQIKWGNNKMWDEHIRTGAEVAGTAADVYSTLTKRKKESKTSKYLKRG